jgi:hypothetical protein
MRDAYERALDVTILHFGAYACIDGGPPKIRSGYWVRGQTISSS